MRTGDPSQRLLAATAMGFVGLVIGAGFGLGLAAAGRSTAFSAVLGAVVGVLVAAGFFLLALVSEDARNGRRAHGWRVLRIGVVAYLALLVASHVIPGEAGETGRLVLRLAGLVALVGALVVLYVSQARDRRSREAGESAAR